MMGKSPVHVSMRFRGPSPEALVRRISTQARDAAGEATKGVTRLAEQNAKDHATRFSRSGRFRDSISSRFRREGNRFVGEVFSDAPYAVQVEKRHAVLARAVKEAAQKLLRFFDAAFRRRFP
ncbi:MAG: HK97 gp10 family phage protein [Nitrospinae bacterium]|nr:HK97 gp10 family phage protein [Nitrospinota bacterium]